jgi:uncharacterized protein (TIGR02118 family)
MIVRTGLLRKKPDWDTERFRSHWHGRHADLARQLKGLSGYLQNLVVKSIDPVPDIPRGIQEFTGFSQLWFNDDADMTSAVSADIGRALVEDERYFMSTLSIVIAKQVEVVPVPKGEPGVKLWSLVKRHGDVSPDRFSHEWRLVHAPLVAATPGVRGYRQNLILERESPKGTPVGYDRLPIDGIAEVWFDNEAAIASAAASPEGKLATATAKSIIAEANSFLVEVRVVI